MPMNLQVKILRVLQEKQVRPVGGSRMVPVDTRIITATNRNLRSLPRENLFLVDLYFRLNILNIHVPPLRERKNGIMLLVAAFCRRHTPSVPAAIFSPAVRDALMRYD